MDKEQVRRISKWLRGEKAPPYFLQIDVTNKCRLKCLPCLARRVFTYTPEKEIPFESLLRLIEEAGAIGVRQIHFTGGGEPIERYDEMFTLMRRVKEFRMTGILDTNGTLFTQSMIEMMVENEWDEIQFSINGPDDEVDDYLRGCRGAFSKSMEAIEAINRIKGDREHPRLNIHVVLTSKNYDRLTDFVDLAYKMRVEKLAFHPLSGPLNDSGEELKIEPKHQGPLRASMEAAKTAALQKGISINFDSSLLDSMESFADSDFQFDNSSQGEDAKESSKIHCIQPWHQLAVSAIGTVGPCGTTIGLVGEEKKENIKGKSLEEVWYGDYIDQFRKGILTGILSPLCRHCCGIQVMENIRIYEHVKKEMSTS